jgi:chromosome segregation ATPase
MHLQLKQTSQVCAQVYLFIITVWLAIHQEKECPWSAPPAILDVGELQIALLECAMEYELKTIETKIKMQELKFHGREIEHQKLEQQPCVEKFAEQQGDSQQISLHRLRKQMMKLQDEKGALSKELSTLRTRERKFDKQQHTLDDALHHVNHLQRFNLTISTLHRAVALVALP